MRIYGLNISIINHTIENVMLKRKLNISGRLPSAMSKKSIAKTITNNAILLFSLSTFAILSVVLYFFQKEIMYSSVVYGELSLKNGALRIEHHLSTQYVLAEELTNTIGYHINSADGEQTSESFLVDYMEKLMNRAEGIDAFFAILEPKSLSQQAMNTPYHDQSGRFIPLITKTFSDQLHEPDAAEFYIKPKSTLKSYVSNPFTYNLNGQAKDLYSISFPLIMDSKFVGVVGCMIDLNKLIDESKKIVIYDGNSTVALLDNNGNYLTHSHSPELIGENLSEDCVNPDERLENLRNGLIDNWFEGAVGGITNPININEHQLPWQLQSKVHARYVFKNVIEAVYWILPTLLICIALFLVIVRWLINKQIKPLSKLSSISETIANGDLTQSIQVASENEIGVLAKSFQLMTNNLRSFISDVQTSADYINNAAQQVSSSSHALSSSTTEQASISEEISCNMEEMTASVQQNAAQSQEFRIAADNTAKKMTTINDEASTATQLQNEVAAQVKVINEIAQNIKILSLNASVEAARAGEYGRGFAVVAREVQKLSEITTNSSTQISQKIQQSVQSAVLTRGLINEISPMLMKLNDGSVEIDNASQEQAQNIQQVTHAAQVFNNTTQSNAASAEELASTSEELSKQAERLAEMVSQFKI